MQQHSINPADDIGSSPLKINLPTKLLEQLNAFCATTKTSKSELVRAYLTKGLESEPIWQQKVYFFKRKTPTDLPDINLNTMVKVVMNSQDNPSSANLVVGLAIKKQGNNITVWIPTFVPYEYNPISQDDIANMYTNISIEASHLSIPEMESWINAFYINEIRFLHTIPLEYLW